MGKLNAKQFIFIAVGGVTIFIVMTTFPITGITIVGVALIAFFSFIFALFKIQDRFIDEWLGNFIFALQSTPQKVWLKQPKIPDILLPGYKLKTSESKQSGIPPQKMEKFIRFWREGAVSNLTEYEHSNLERIQKQQSQLDTEQAGGNQPVNNPELPLTDHEQ